MPEKQQPLEEPKGTKSGRQYRIMVLQTVDTESIGYWHDFKWSPGATPQAAVKAARANYPKLRALIADGQPVLPIAEGDFNPLIVTIETIEREAFKKADL